MVTVLGRGRIAIGDLEPGDRVLDGSPAGWSRFVAQLHRDTESRVEFVSILISGLGDPLEATPDHFIYRRDASTHARVVVKVGDVLPGDILIHVATDGVTSDVVVESVHRFFDVGFVSPLTESYQIVVNGIAATCTTFVSDLVTEDPEARVSWYYPLMLLNRIHPGLASSAGPGVHWYSRMIFVPRRWISSLRSLFYPPHPSSHRPSILPVNQSLVPTATRDLVPVGGRESEIAPLEMYDYARCTFNPNPTQNISLTHFGLPVVHDAILAPLMNRSMFGFPAWWPAPKVATSGDLGLAPVVPRPWQYGPLRSGSAGVSTAITGTCPAREGDWSFDVGLQVCPVPGSTSQPPVCPLKGDVELSSPALYSQVVFPAGKLGRV